MISNKKVFKLNNGIEMPVLGFGTALISEDDTVTTQVVIDAIKSGYRHIDTAKCYENESAVGEAIRNCGVPREELFITTKLWTTDQREGRQREAFEESLERLGLDYVDMYLIHWPVPGKVLESWRIMEELYKEGRIRAIGLSNCHEHLIYDIERECEIMPALNQYEFHPHVTSNKLRAFCESKNIQFEAFYPLGHGTYMQNRTLIEIGDKYGKNVPQVLLRWALQHGVSTIPKTTSKERMIQNQSIFDFELTPGDMVRIDAMDTGVRIVDADPDNVDF